MGGLGFGGRDREYLQRWVKEEWGWGEEKNGDIILFLWGVVGGGGGGGGRLDLESEILGHPSPVLYCNMYLNDLLHDCMIDKTIVCHGNMMVDCSFFCR